MFIRIGARVINLDNVTDLFLGKTEEGPANIYFNVPSSDDTAPNIQLQGQEADALRWFIRTQGNVAIYGFLVYDVGEAYAAHLASADLRERRQRGEFAPGAEVYNAEDAAMHGTVLNVRGQLVDIEVFGAGRYTMNAASLRFLDN